MRNPTTMATNRRVIWNNPRWTVFVLWWLWSWNGVGIAEDGHNRDIEFFEAKIRPVFVNHCYKCHGPEKQEAGLRLDSREGWLEGGDSGPAVVPGEPEKSLLWRAVGYDDVELQMPPDGKLPPTVIADIAEWIRRGAAGPARSPTRAAGKGPKWDAHRAAEHWAYQLRPCPPVPFDVHDQWSYNEVDRFIWERLQEAKLTPAVDASDEVWLRRVYFDLVGLPPSPEERQRFLEDTQPDRFERLVDQLLASPRFGERWGRHWLDVVRYAESLTLRGFLLREAWRYRDYVIHAYNEDMSYAQFIREQIAGDLLAGADWQERQRQCVATTFWMLGNTNLEEQDKRQLDMDVIDEQLDVIGRGLLAQTITCARCHDHKFDPIPTTDYYSLAAILRNLHMLEHANVSKWLEVPLPLPAEEERQFQELEQRLAALEASMEQHRQQLASLERPTSGGPPTIVAVETLPGIVVDDSQAKKVGLWQVSQYAKRYVGDGYVHDQNAEKGSKTITFHPHFTQAGRYEVRLAYTPGGNRATNVPVTVFSADGEVTKYIDQRREPPVDGHFVSLGLFRFEANDQGFVLVSNEGTDGHVIADAVQFLPVDDAETTAGDAQRSGSPQADERARVLRQELAEMQTQWKQLQGELAKRPRVITVRETGRVQPMRVHIRGNHQNLGAEVTRGFLSVIDVQPPPAWPEHESGRRELAEWLVSPQNPLTARVYVNRVWHWLFGAGLVRSPDNFGTTGELPTHPELLNYLTYQFIEHGWSTKWLIRQLVLSHTYRQASTTDAEKIRTDPENRLWGRMLRRRLEAECLRDAMLVISGEISWQMGGSTIPPQLTSDYGYEEQSVRRSVYVPVFRNALPEIFSVFDFADPSVTTGARNTSTVAPQALYMMNHPFPQMRAEHTAGRLLSMSSDNQQIISHVFLLIFGRMPSQGELTECLQFLEGQQSDGSEAERRQRLTRLVHALFGSVEFRYID